MCVCVLLLRTLAMVIRPSPSDFSNDPLSKYSHILRNGGQGFNTGMQGTQAPWGIGINTSSSPESD